jgi:hypothetical protein
MLPFALIQPTSGPCGTTVRIAIPGKAACFKVQTVLVGFTAVPFLRVLNTILVTIPCSASITAAASSTIIITVIGTRETAVIKRKGCSEPKKRQCKEVKVCESAEVVRFSVRFNIVPTVVALTIIDVTPDTGSVGSPVTLIGSGFLPTDVITVGGVPVGSFTVSPDGTRIDFVVPPQTPNGPTTIVVTNPATGESASIPFNVVLPRLCRLITGPLSQFRVLASTTVTAVPNVAPSVVVGSVGVSPTGTVTGFPPGIVTGTIENGTTLAATAKAQAQVLYDTIASLPADVNLSGQDLAGMTLTPGVYRFDTNANLTSGPLNLNAQGDPDAQFIFQIGTNFTMSDNSSVNLLQGAESCNVFFQVGDSFTLGSSSEFIGTLVASQSISVGTGSTVTNRLVSLNDAIIINSTIFPPISCSCP